MKFSLQRFWIVTQIQVKPSKAKYLELGAVPIHFQIMKRKLGFLQYILKQNKNSMIYKILQKTSESSVKNDFVYTCKKYSKTLNLEMTFEEI